MAKFRNCLFGLAVMVAALLAVSSLCLASPQQVKNEVAAPLKQSEEERKKVFNAETFLLDNGMEIVVVPNHRAPVVTHMVWYKAGAADEPWGKSGIAHYLEHMMFKGSERIGMEPIGPGEFSQIVRSLGGQDNAFTSKDYTAYFQSVPADKLETVMRMEAGRMKAITAPPEHADSELKVILEERRQRTDNDPQARFHEQMVAQAFINHPYGIPTIGWKHEIEKMTWNDIKAFHDQWYVPNNAILIVTGDVTPANVFQLAIDIYGSIPRREPPVRKWASSPPLPSPVVMKLQDPVIQEPAVQTLYRVPSHRKNKEDSLALEILSEILAGGSSGRLYQSLVMDKKIATGVDFSYDSSAIEDAQLWTHATPVKGQDLQALNNALLDELRKVVAKGVTPKELEDAKTRLQDQTAYALDSLSGPAMIIGQSLASGISLEDIEYWPYDIARVTAEQVQSVATHYLDPDKISITPPVTGYLLPAPGQDEKASPAPRMPSSGAIR